MVTGMLALRFLTDYLDGDRYFRIERPLHNLERARNQLALYEALVQPRATCSISCADDRRMPATSQVLPLRPTCTESC